MAVAGGGGVAVAGRGSSIGVVVGWAVISGMCASAELPGVTPMAAVTAVVVVGLVGGGSAVCVLGYRICYSKGGADANTVAAACCAHVGAVGWLPWSIRCVNCLA